MKEIKLGDLSPTRDFNFVKDVCRAMLAIAECDVTIGKEVNIAHNQEISMGDLFKLIKATMNADVRFVCDKERLRPKNSEVFRLRGDNSLLKGLVGFSSRCSLKEGLRITFEWFTRPETLKHYKANMFTF